MLEVSVLRNIITIYAKIKIGLIDLISSPSISKTLLNTEDPSMNMMSSIKVPHTPPPKPLRAFNAICGYVSFCKDNGKN